mgnify:CR=1 FL=1
MTTQVADEILQCLQRVQIQRDRRAALAGLELKASAVKAYQQARFCVTHQDLLISKRYGEAARFFLNDLYGPADFSQRDAQFARVVPALVRLFPQNVCETVLHVSQLHALSEELDSELAQNLVSSDISASNYIQAWQACENRDRREQQIQLILQVGEALDRYTRKPMLGAALRMMRGPANAIGLADLQAFLERGFDTFKRMGGAKEFLACVREREFELIAKLFETDSDGTNPNLAWLLTQLPKLGQSVGSKNDPV